MKPAEKPALKLELYGKRRPLPWFAFNSDLAAHDLKHPLDQRQPQAVSLRGVGRVALIEFFEDPCLGLWTDAAAGIPDRHQHTAVF